MTLDYQFPGSGNSAPGRHTPKKRAVLRLQSLATWTIIDSPTQVSFLPDGTTAARADAQLYWSPYERFDRVQELSAAQSGTAVTWLRSGASPELSHVTFELSTDGIIFTQLGEGTRITGGWELTGLALPRGQNLFIRAYGYYGTGWYSSSGSLIESIRYVYLTNYPQYLPLIKR